MLISQNKYPVSGRCAASMSHLDVTLLRNGSLIFSCTIRSDLSGVRVHTHAFGTGSRIDVKLQEPDGSSQTGPACERDRGALYQVGHLAGRDSWLQGFLSGVIAALSQCLPHRSPQCAETVSLFLVLTFFFVAIFFLILYTPYVLIIFFFLFLCHSVSSLHSISL